VVLISFSSCCASLFLFDLAFFLPFFSSSGKSALLRQAGSIVILAQIGCWVPARVCRLAPFDHIFTRIGAGDRIVEGISTFQLEMKETATILDHVTSRSFVAFDELGRGTSSRDGMAIASAVVRELNRKDPSPLCLFATHYRLLVKKFENDRKVAAYQMECDATDRTEMKCTYRFTKGICDGSYANNVANAVGLPARIIQRAIEIGKLYEQKSKTPPDKKSGRKRQATNKTKSTSFDRQRARYTACLWLLFCRLPCFCFHVFRLRVILTLEEQRAVSAAVDCKNFDLVVELIKRVQISAQSRAKGSKELTTACSSAARPPPFFPLTASSAKMNTSERPDSRADDDDQLQRETVQSARGQQSLSQQERSNAGTGDCNLSAAQSNPAAALSAEELPSAPTAFEGRRKHDEFGRDLPEQKEGHGANDSLRALGGSILTPAASRTLAPPSCLQLDERNSVAADEQMAMVLENPADTPPSVAHGFSRMHEVQDSSTLGLNAMQLTSAKQKQEQKEEEQPGNEFGDGAKEFLSGSRPDTFPLPAAAPCTPPRRSIVAATNMTEDSAANSSRSLPAELHHAAEPTVAPPSSVSLASHEILKEGAAITSTALPTSSAAQAKNSGDSVPADLSPPLGGVADAEMNLESNTAGESECDTAQIAAFLHTPAPASAPRASSAAADELCAIPSDLKRKRTSDAERRAVQQPQEQQLEQEAKEAKENQQPNKEEQKGDDEEEEEEFPLPKRQRRRRHITEDSEEIDQRNSNLEPVLCTVSQAAVCDQQRTLASSAKMNTSERPDSRADDDDQLQRETVQSARGEQSVRPQERSNAGTGDCNLSAAQPNPAAALSAEEFPRSPTTVADVARLAFEGSRKHDESGRDLLEQKEGHGANDSLRALGGSILTPAASRTLAPPSCLQLDERNSVAADEQMAMVLENPADTPPSVAHGFSRMHEVQDSSTLGLNAMQLTSAKQKQEQKEEEQPGNEFGDGAKEFLSGSRPDTFPLPAAAPCTPPRRSIVAATNMTEDSAANSSRSLPAELHHAAEPTVAPPSSVSLASHEILKEGAAITSTALPTSSAAQAKNSGDSVPADLSPPLGGVADAEMNLESNTAGESECDTAQIAAFLHTPAPASAPRASSAAADELCAIPSDLKRKRTSDAERRAVQQPQEQQLEQEAKEAKENQQPNKEEQKGDDEEEEEEFPLPKRQRRRRHITEDSEEIDQRNSNLEPVLCTVSQAAVCDQQRTLASSAKMNTSERPDSRADDDDQLQRETVQSARGEQSVRPQERSNAGTGDCNLSAAQPNPAAALSAEEFPRSPTTVADVARLAFEGSRKHDESGRDLLEQKEGHGANDSLRALGGSILTPAASRTLAPPSCLQLDERNSVAADEQMAMVLENPADTPPSVAHGFSRMHEVQDSSTLGLNAMQLTSAKQKQEQKEEEQPGNEFGDGAKEFLSGSRPDTFPLPAAAPCTPPRRSIVAATNMTEDSAANSSRSLPAELHHAAEPTVAPPSSVSLASHEILKEGAAITSTALPTSSAAQAKNSGDSVPADLSPPLGGVADAEMNLESNTAGESECDTAQIAAFLHTPAPASAPRASSAAADELCAIPSDLKRKRTSDAERRAVQQPQEQQLEQEAKEAKENQQPNKEEQKGDDEEEEEEFPLPKRQRRRRHITEDSEEIDQRNSNLEPVLCTVSQAAVCDQQRTLASSAKMNTSERPDSRADDDDQLQRETVQSARGEQSVRPQERSNAGTGDCNLSAAQPNPAAALSAEELPRSPTIVDQVPRAAFQAPRQREFGDDLLEHKCFPRETDFHRQNAAAERGTHLSATGSPSPFVTAPPATVCAPAILSTTAGAETDTVHGNKKNEEAAAEEAATKRRQTATNTNSNESSSEHSKPETSRRTAKRPKTTHKEAEQQAAPAEEDESESKAEVEAEESTRPLRPPKSSGDKLAAQREKEDHFQPLEDASAEGGSGAADVSGTSLAIKNFRIDGSRRSKHFKTEDDLGAEGSSVVFTSYRKRGRDATLSATEEEREEKESEMDKEDEEGDANEEEEEEEAEEQQQQTEKKRTDKGQSPEKVQARTNESSSGNKAKKMMKIPAATTRSPNPPKSAKPSLFQATPPHTASSHHRALRSSAAAPAAAAVPASSAALLPQPANQDKEKRKTEADGKDESKSDMQERGDKEGQPKVIGKEAKSRTMTSQSTVNFGTAAAAPASNLSSAVDFSVDDYVWLETRTNVYGTNDESCTKDAKRRTLGKVLGVQVSSKRAKTIKSVSYAGEVATIRFEGSEPAQRMKPEKVTVQIQWYYDKEGLLLERNNLECTPSLPGNKVPTVQQATLILNALTPDDLAELEGEQRMPLHAIVERAETPGEVRFVGRITGSGRYQIRTKESSEKKKKKKKKS
jgi:hypothetical protein